jgi:hypothetical protein
VPPRRKACGRDRPHVSETKYTNPHHRHPAALQTA